MKHKNGISKSNKSETITKIAELPSLQILLDRYEKDPHFINIRFGQWFYNNYCLIMSPDPFYMDFDDTITVIAQWLKDHQHVYVPPITIKQCEEECYAK